MKKIILFYIIGLIIWVIIWKYVHFDRVFFTKNVTICNNSEYDFHSFEINKNYTAEWIAQWECKKITYNKINDNKISMKIYVHEDENIFIFETQPTDNIWKTKISQKNMEISINELNKGEKYMTEYIDSVNFEIIKK